MHVYPLPRSQMVGDCLQFFTRNTSPGTKALVKAWLLPVKRYLIALFQRNLIEIQYGVRERDHWGFPSNQLALSDINYTFLD